MKLTFVLFVLLLKMRKAIRSNDLFQRRLKTRTGSILIQTADKSSGRLFVFSKGHLFTKAGCYSNADVTMIWKDSNTAFEVMTSSDSLAMTRALNNGDLLIEGDPSIAQWFSLLIKAIKGNKIDSEKKKTLKVAFIGLGKMGSGMAENIQNAGYELVVYNRTPSKAEPFVEKGAVLANSPAEAASHANIVVTSLMDDSSVKEVVTAENGILSGLAKGGIHLCTTTISPKLARELTQLHREHGSHFVTGAVVGRPDAAQAGELLTLMGGDKKSVEECMYVSSTYSAANLNISEEASMANYAKLSVNYFAISNMELMGQIYAYGETTGIGKKFYAQLFEASYANPVLKFYAKKILNRDFQKNVGFELSGGLKDVNLMQAASNETSKSLEYAPIIISKMEKAISLGWDKQDWSVFTDLAFCKDGV